MPLADAHDLRDSGGAGDALAGAYWLEEDEIEMATPPEEKPPYRVPLMAEIAKLKWNGFIAIDLFSGFGGTCIGSRMAGFRVLWANEFVPAAQESYRANMRKGTILDGRDIKQVKAAEILAAIKLGMGDIDYMSGSPPCQPFSSAGARERGWGKERKYAHGAEQKNEELFFDYIRIRDGLMPKVFMAENVSGLVKGTAKGFFLEILRELKRGYRVEARLLDAQWLGVPQCRQRVIFVGVRDDLGLGPAFPDPLPYRYSVRDALPWLGPVTGGNYANFSQRGAAIPRDRPAPTIAAGVHGGGPHQFVVHDTGRRGQTPRDVTDEPCPMITAGPDDAGDGGGPRNHFKVTSRRVEVADVVPDNVGASIEGYAIEREYDKLNPGQASEKFFNLVRPDPGKPCPTVTAYGAAGGGIGTPGGVASVCHPTEKRKFSIAELKRICGAPDDVVLTGSYAQQWERLGNSVPPMMAFHIAAAIRDRVLLPARAEGRSKATRNVRNKPRGSSPPATAAASSPAPRTRRRGAAAPTDAG